MKENRITQESDEIIERAMEAARERDAMPLLPDVLKREYNEVLSRPCNEALEKRGSAVDEMIERDMERRRRLEKKLPPLEPPAAPTPKREGPDMDIE
jgi:hypothetical protein